MDDRHGVLRVAEQVDNGTDAVEGGFELRFWPARRELGLDDQVARQDVVGLVIGEWDGLHEVVVLAREVERRAEPAVLVIVGRHGPARVTDRAAQVVVFVAGIHEQRSYACPAPAPPGRACRGPVRASAGVP